jgi:hypothetical protein
LTHPVLRRLAARVIPELDLLTLRERVYGAPFLRRAKVLFSDGDLPAIGSPVRAGSGVSVCLTGDDALVAQLTTPPASTDDGRSAIGVNVRVSNYSGLSDGVGPVFAEAMWSAAAEHGAGLIALPVSNYPENADLPAIRRALGPAQREGVPFVGEPATSPDALMRAAERCRAVVTGSYHAAVFALGRGIPVVALSASKYYDVKFDGLRDLYPNLIETVRFDASLSSRSLAGAVGRAYGVGEVERRDGRFRTSAMVQSADAAFESFAERVDATLHHVGATR